MRGWPLALLGLAAALCAPASKVTAAPVSILVPDAVDIRNSTLIGPSGQVYEPAKEPSPRWVRRTAGGVAATVASAARLEGDVVVAGTQTPLYRQRDRQWGTSSLGQRGRVVLGTGPFFAIAVGRQIFVRSKGNFLRVGAVTGTVLHLWASSEASVLVATDQGVFRRRGAAFVLAAKVLGVLGFTGAAPYAVTVDTAINLKTGAHTRLPAAALGVVRSATSPAAILKLPSAQLELATDLAGAVAPMILPLEQPPVAAAIDSAGRAILLTGLPGPDARPGASATPTSAAATGTTGAAVLVFDGTTWSAGAVVDELPPARNGPPPAISQ